MKNIRTIEEIVSLDDEFFNFDRGVFSLISGVWICSNVQDYIFRDPLEDFAITYGTFLDFVCLSPEDLIASFTIDDAGFVAFRKPDNPNETYTVENIETLLNILENQNPDYLRNYTEKVTPLITKIRMLLTATNKVELNEYVNIFSQLSEDDKSHLVNIFINFFETGMYQRTWKGPGNHWPLTYESTQGSCQEDIEIKIPPLLNDISDLVANLSPDALQIYLRLPVIDYDLETNVFIAQSESLTTFESNTRIGDLCIGYGSRLMIYSSYFYLLSLNLSVEGFDLAKFNPSSTHR